MEASPSLSIHKDNKNNKIQEQDSKQSEEESKSIKIDQIRGIKIEENYH
tara:strand:+ start:83 stop:229 length:147 start_codon:yes stop_codon:yes gene_type:complete